MVGRIDRCPICKVRDISIIEMHREKNKVKDEMICLMCKTTWQNVYTFSKHAKIIEDE